MSARILDAPLIELTDSADARPLPAALPRARADVLAAAVDVLALPEEALTQPWAWIGGSEEDVRYSVYRAAEALEKAEVEARQLVAPRDAGERQAARIVGPSTAARWDLHGLLLPLDEAMLDADPGGGEWTVRRTMGHVITSQRGYGWGTAWWMASALPATEDLPEGAPDEFWAPMPEEDVVVAGRTVAEVRRTLDDLLDLSAERLAGLPDDRLGHGARWSGYVVTVGFRMARWPSHMREHAIQIDKTFAMLGHVPTEPARLVRHLLAAYGRAESAVFGRAGVEDAVERIASGAAEAREAIASGRAAAGV